MKVTSLLKQQHRNTRRALAQLIKAGGQEGEELRAQLADELVAHMMIEEKIIYPRAREIGKKADFVEISFEEHDLSRYALIRLLEADPTSAELVVRAKSLKKLLDSHTADEESLLFPMLERAYDAAEMRALAEELKDLFERTVEAGYENGLRALQIEPAYQPKRGAAPKSAADNRASLNGRAHEARA
jgi:iron-sulfur cluster repair protein YtfE (RIC family)